MLYLIYLIASVPRGPGVVALIIPRALITLPLGSRPPPSLHIGFSCVDVMDLVLLLKASLCTPLVAHRRRFLPSRTATCPLVARQQIEVAAISVQVPTSSAGPRGRSEVMDFACLVLLKGGPGLRTPHSRLPNNNPHGREEDYHHDHQQGQPHRAGLRRPEGGA